MAKYGDDRDWQIDLEQRIMRAFVGADVPKRDEDGWVDREEALSVIREVMTTLNEDERAYLIKRCLWDKMLAAERFVSACGDEAREGYCRV